MVIPFWAKQPQGTPQPSPQHRPTANGSQQPYSVVIEQRGKNEVLLMENHAIVALCKCAKLPVRIDCNAVVNPAVILNLCMSTNARWR